MAQIPGIIEDYFPGPEGPIDNRIHNFRETLIYKGKLADGTPAIYQYKSEVDPTTVLLTSDMIQGTIAGLASNGEQAIVYVSENNGGLTGFYKSFESDFSDLQQIYRSDGRIVRFRFYDGFIVILEEVQEADLVVNIKIATDEGAVSEVLSGLPRTATDYNVGLTGDYLMIAPEIDPIDGNNLIVYNTNLNSIVPVTDALTNFEDCGPASSFYIANETILAITCDSTKLYDIPTQRYLTSTAGRISVQFDDARYTYYSTSSNNYRYDKDTNTEELLLENVMTGRGNAVRQVSAVDNGGNVDFVNYDYKKQESTVISTPFNTLDFDYRFSGIAEQGEEFHTTSPYLNMYSSSSDTAFLLSFFTQLFVIDTLYDINGQFRPVEYGLGIYYTHNDPTYGRELFGCIQLVIDNTDDLPQSIVNAYPNPSNEYITVETDSDSSISHISLVNMQGQEVATAYASNVLQTGSLTPGIYTLLVTLQSGEVLSKKASIVH